MRRLPLLLFALVWVAVTYAGAGNPAAKSSPKAVPMVASFRDNFALTPTDRVGSDGLGAYIDGQLAVKAIIDGTGNFDLDTDTSGQAGRSLLVDLGACATPPCTPPFSGSTQVDAYVSTGAGDLLNMTVGSSKASRLQILFLTPLAPATQWFLRFDHATYPDTSTVTVTRMAANQWRIEAASSAIAKLLSATTKGKMVLKDHGNYFVPFEATITLK
jgi:hypothetical protein